MRHFSLIVITVLPLLFFSCQKDAEVSPKVYPYILTNTPDVVSDGVILYSKIISLGKEKKVKCGFVWSEEENPDLSDNKVFIDGKVDVGLHLFEMNSGLEVGMNYYVRAFLLTDNIQVFGNQVNFKCLGCRPPEILNFEPKFGPSGTNVTIEGKNFGYNRSNINVMFGDTKATVDSISNTKIHLKIPTFNIPKKVLLKVETVGVKALSKDSIDIWFPWSKKMNINFKNVNYSSFSFGSVGYIIEPNTNSILEYDPKINKLVSKTILPVNSGSDPASTSNATSAYLLLDNSIYKFNPTNYNFSLFATYPLTRHQKDFIFILDDEIYVGSATSKTLLKYVQKTNTWENKKFDSNFQYIPSIDYMKCYTYKNTVYFFTFINADYPSLATFRIFKYLPETDTWQLLTTYPFTNYGFGVEFFINDKIYVGLGTNNSNNSFFEYDLSTNKWIKFKSAPKRFYNNVSLSIENKGYAFVLYDDYRSYEFLNELWQFDPSKN